MRKIDIIRYTEVNKHFGVEGPEVALVPTFVIEFETKFQLEVRENKIIIPPPRVQVYGHLEICPRTPRWGL